MHRNLRRDFLPRCCKLSSHLTVRVISLSVNCVEEIREDFPHPQLVYAKTKRPMQFDMYIPTLLLAVEYQGKQHYEDLFYFGSTVRCVDHCE